MRQIIIDVDEKQLEDMVAHLKSIEPEYEVKDAFKLLELMIKKDLQFGYGNFMDRFIDGGGNALIGDCLEEEECKGIVVEHAMPAMTHDSIKGKSEEELRLMLRAKLKRDGEMGSEKMVDEMSLREVEEELSKLLDEEDG